jgi:hypothetical protein
MLYLMCCYNIERMVLIILRHLIVAPDVLLQCRKKGLNNFETLNKASRDLLYKECKGYYKEHTVLWMTLELLKLKASNR